MTLIQLVFYVLSAIAIFSGLMVVAANNPVRGALFLVLAFFSMAGIWLLLHAEFLALILVLVYVGAVMTLFLFVVMMLRVDAVKMREGFVRYLPFAVLMIFLIMGLSIIEIGPKHFGLALLPAPALKPADYSNITELGLLLYTDYFYPFEISGVILLTAIVAAISLSHRKPKNRKGQIIQDQVDVKRAERVKMLTIPGVKKIQLPGIGQ